MDLRKHSLIIVAVLLLVLIGGFFYVNKRQSAGQAASSFAECVALGNPVLESYPPQCRDESGNSFTQDIGNEMQMQDMIVIENPRPNQTIESPLMLKGRARGMYFFEGSFPVTLVDAQGNVLAEGFVTADGEWMTEDFVPFSGELTFEGQGDGKLLLRRNNPAPEEAPQNNATLEVPVSF